MKDLPQTAMKMSTWPSSPNWSACEGVMEKLERGNCWPEGSKQNTKRNVPTKEKTVFLLVVVILADYPFQRNEWQPWDYLVPNINLSMIDPPQMYITGHYINNPKQCTSLRKIPQNHHTFELVERLNDSLVLRRLVGPLQLLKAPWNGWFFYQTKMQACTKANA